jgi:isopentenyldiphosphate isomerase
MIFLKPREQEMPLLDALDENGNPLGITLSKAEIHERGLWHRASHVWVYNPRGEILLQLRAADKDSYPGLLDISAAGHVDSGETPLEVALREVEEEIGITIIPEQLEPLCERRTSYYIEDIDWQDNELDSVYLLRFEGSIEDFSLADGEVERLEFIPIAELETELADAEARKKYVPHGEYYGLIIESVGKRL